MRTAVACCVLGCLIVLSGCAESGYDARKLGAELERAGLSPKQARCVTDGMEAKFDPRQLASHSEPTAEELATTRALIEECGVTLQPRP